MTIQELDQFQRDNTFHHATYRNFGTLWEGLHVYIIRADGFRGYEHAGFFAKNHRDLKRAEDMCRGFSVGSYGQG